MPFLTKNNGASKWRVTGALSLETSLVLALTMLLFGWLQFLTPYLNGHDGYYHIKYSYLLARGELFQDFPWAQFSWWTDHFADKEFLFHVLLIPFTYLFDDLATAAKWATVILASGFVASFNLILAINKVTMRHLWLILLLGAADVFTYRLFLPRPHILSMILTLWIVDALINRRLLALAILCCFYTHSYTAIHMPIIMAITVIVGQWLMSDKVNWRLLVIVVGSVVGASLFSPFFPNNWLIFYVQNIEFAWQQIFLDVNLFQGSEIKPMSTRYLFLYGLPLLLVLAASWYLLLLKGQKNSNQARHLWAIFAVYFALTLMSKRFVEYSYPLGLMFCALFFKGVNLRQQFGKVQLAIILAFFIIVATVSGVASIGNLKRDLSRAQPSPYQEVANFFRTNTPPTTTLFTCDWDDAPELFYFNHHNRYLVFMEPLLMHSWSPEIWQDWFDIANGKLDDNQTIDLLVNKFKLSYGLCTKDFDKLRAILERHQRAEIIYRDDHAYGWRIVDSKEIDR